MRIVAWVIGLVVLVWAAYGVERYNEWDNEQERQFNACLDRHWDMQEWAAKRLCSAVQRGEAQADGET